MRVTRLLAIAFAMTCVSVAADANGGKKSSAAPKRAAAQQLCNGTFSNGVSIKVGLAVYMPDVGYIDKTTPLIPVNSQTPCDVHTFAWNQFLYLTQNLLGGPGPRFMQMAPWYNTLTTGAKPGAYPGGATDLRTAMLDQGQAGTDGHLLDVAGQTVRYDIRFDENMYTSIVAQNFYTAPLYNTACNPDFANNGACKNNDKIWMIPAGANEHPEPGATELKTAWRDFGTPSGCPASEFFCQGRFGLVGFHFVNKTFSHGEWIWASFEHVANAPDCTVGGDTPIAPMSPINSSWSFFNTQTVPSGVMSSKTCNVAMPPGQCNTNPNPSGDRKTWVPTNVCRTDLIAAGGASSANCGSANSSNDVACLNATIMPQRSGVWRNYKLVGAVWVQGGMGPNTDFRIQNFQTQVPNIPYVAPAGFVHLANTAIETWLQPGSTGYDPFGNNATGAGCFECHHQPSSFGSSKQADLSHFPGKLPLLKLQALRNSLLPANSTVPAPK